MNVYSVCFSTIYSKDIEQKVLSRASPRDIKILKVVRSDMNQGEVEAKLVVFSDKSLGFVTETLKESYTLWGCRPHKFNVDYFR